MKTTLPFLALMFSLTIGAPAQDRAGATGTVFFGGKYYKEARVSAVKGIEATIRAAGNQVATVPISILPPALKAEAEAKLAENAAMAKRFPEKAGPAAALAPGETRGSGRVIQVMKEGLLVERGEQMVLLKDHPSAGNIADGERVNFRGMEDGVFKYVTTLGAAATVRVIRVTSAN